MKSIIIGLLLMSSAEALKLKQEIRIKYDYNSGANLLNAYKLYNMS